MTRKCEEMVDEIPRELQLSRQATFAATSSGELTKWKAPESGSCKFNMDASWIPQITGIGSLLKDSRGAFHLSLTKKLIHSPSSEHAEACAMLESLKIAACFGHSRVVFESDCKTLVDVISSLGYALCTLDHIYSRIRLLFHHIHTTQLVLLGAREMLQHTY